MFKLYIRDKAVAERLIYELNINYKNNSNYAIRKVVDEDLYIINIGITESLMIRSEIQFKENGKVDYKLLNTEKEDVDLLSHFFKVSKEKLRYKLKNEIKRSDKMNFIEKNKKVESNNQNILSLEKENEELTESMEETMFKVKVESVAFGYKIAKKGDVVSIYDCIGTFTRLHYNNDWKIFSYSELEVLFEEI